MEQLLTVKEAADYLRVSQATLWRWCQEGRVPAFKIGHEWRVVSPALQRLVEAAGLPDAPCDVASLSSAEEASPDSV